MLGPPPAADAAFLADAGSTLLACATPGDLAQALASRVHHALGGACRVEIPGAPPAWAPAPAATAPPAPSFLQVPLSGGGHVTWWAADDARREPPVPLLQTLAAFASAALGAQMRVAQAREESSQRAHRLLAVSSALGAAATPDEVVRVVVEQGVAVLGAHAGALGRLDPADGHVKTLGTIGYPPELVAMFRSVPLEARTPLTDAAREREGIFLEDGAARAARYPHLARAREVNGGGAMVAAPLDPEGRIDGALGLTFREPRRFSPDERAFILALARQCGHALERARLHEAERTAREDAEASRARLALLLDASNVLSGPLDSQATLDALAMVAVRSVADACTVYLREGDLLEPRATRARDPALERRTREVQSRYPHDVRAPGGLAAVYRSAKPLVVPRITDEMLIAAAKGKDHLDDLRALRMRSSMILPLRVGEEVAGVLVLTSVQEGRAYGDADLALAEELARRASLALENARLLEATREAQARLDVLVRSIPGVVWESGVGPDAQRPGFVSRHVEEMLGYTTEEWLSAPDFWLRVVHPDDRAETARLAAEARERGGLATQRFRWVAKGGRVVDVLARVSIVHDERGRPVGMRGVALDVTDAKRAEERLHLYHRIFLGAQDAIGVIDPEGRYVEQNPAHRALLGYGDEEILGETPALHLRPEDLRVLLADLARDGHARGEYESRAKDGRVSHVDLSAFTVRDAQGRVAYHVGIQRDVTSRKRAEADLRDRIREVEAVYRMTDNLARATREDEVHAAGLDCVADLLDTPVSGVCLEEGDACRVAAWRNLSRTFREAIESRPVWNAPAPGQPFVLADVEREAPEAWRDALLKEGIRALALFPLAHHGRSFGKLLVCRESAHAFSPGELRRGATIASHLSFGLARVRAEEAVRASEARLSTIIGALAEGIMLFDAAGNVVMENAAAARLVGSTTRGLQEAAAHEPRVWDMDGRPYAPEDFPVARAMARGEHVHGEEMLLRRAEGDEIALSVNAVPVRDTAGRIVGAATSFTDITEKKGAERALRESEARFRTLAEVVPEIVWTARADGWADYFNPRWFAMTGMTLAQSQGRGWMRAMHADDVDAFLAGWTASLARGEPFEMEYRLRTAEGDARWHLARAAPLYAPGGKVVKWFGSLTDIDDRKAAEEEVRRSELWLRSIFDSLDEAVLVVAYPQRVISNANLALERLFGYSREEVLGQSTRVLHVDDAHFAEYGKRIAEAFARGEAARFEFTVRRKDGSTFPSQQTVSLLKGSDGQTLGGLCVVRDLTEEKRALEELEGARRQVATTEKLSALGSLVSGVAHEIRTPLAYITNHLFLIQQRLDKAAKRPEEAEALHQEIARHGAAMMEGVERINRIVGELRRFTRLKAGERASAPLDLVVLEAVDLFRATHRGRVSVEADLHPVPSMRLDRVQVQQVVLNLLDNGADAMGRAGVLKVATRAVPGGAQLTIMDAGPGIPAEVQARMFDPLFTTKREGTGLGLSIVRRIVEAHGGTVRFDTLPGKGTTFHVFFPQA